MADTAAIYSPSGKRDPFRPLFSEEANREVASMNALEKYSIEQFQLRAILQGLGKARVMFEDPDGKSHILTEGDLFGRERATVSRILNTGVIVTVKSSNYQGVESLYEKIISLPSK